MTIKGGMDRSTLRPVQRDGMSLEDSEALGTHRGDYESLNVQNPQPGYNYSWIRRKSKDVIKYTRRGYAVVRSDDPESMGMIENPDLGAAGLDTTYELGDVVLVRIPLDRFRALRETDNQAALDAVNAATSGNEYLDRDTLTGKPIAGGKSIYHKLRDHRTIQSDQPE